MKKIILFIFLLMIAGCEKSNNEAKVNGRWYAASQVNDGRVVYEKHCISCHGVNGQGTTEWKIKTADGSYPPPPLNGTAHTWHHPLSVLKRTLDRGGIPLGGKMPAFGDKLSANDKDAVIAFFQSQWKQKIYDDWIKRGGLN